MLPVSLTELQLASHFIFYININQITCFAQMTASSSFRSSRIMLLLASWNWRCCQKLKKVRSVQDLKGSINGSSRKKGFWLTPFIPKLWHLDYPASWHTSILSLMSLAAAAATRCSFRSDVVCLSCHPPCARNKQNVKADVLSQMLDFYFWSFTFPVDFLSFWH